MSGLFACDLPPYRPTDLEVCWLFQLFLFAWLGHAVIWTSILNRIYALPLQKHFLKLWRVFTGVVILTFPFFNVVRIDWDHLPVAYLDFLTIRYTTLWPFYIAPCAIVGGVIFPIITVWRLLRRPPKGLLSSESLVIDYRSLLGPAAVGNGKHNWLARIPINDCLRGEFTDLELRPAKLPPALDGLTVLLLSDLHFHGTPSPAWFDAVFDRLAAQPKPDVLVLAGDFVDTDTHHEWIRPILGRLGWNEIGLAILGNHDLRHQPDRVRSELSALGLAVLGNGWQSVTIRGEPVVVVGHEGPWFQPAPDLKEAPPAPFRLCVSHTPDHFHWGQRNGIGLMLCGHTHGGAIRIPIVGSIFVPSLYGRRYDQGVFAGGDTLVVVGRGLSGREPIRFRCLPQVIRMTLRA